MRILHVATLITPDGAYGGPVRVASNQCKALLEAGHDVTFAAGASGFGKKLPLSFDGLPVRLFKARNVIPGMGFAALAAPGLRRWLSNQLHTYDILHVHLARDMVTLPTALLARKNKLPYVVQTHGMIVNSEHLLAPPVDRIWTNKALVGARAVVHLTPAERKGIQAVSPDIRLFAELRNGVPTQQLDYSEHRSEVEVLFMARLHAVKRPIRFVQMAIELNKLFPDVKFRLVGPDEGEGKAVRKMISESNMGDKLAWDGALNPNETLARMARATIYVLPSERDAFPMSVLEAMSLGIPVVVTPGCGLADHVASVGAGAVADDSLEGLVNELRILLSDLHHSAMLGHNARKSALVDFNMNNVGSNLEDIYTRAISANF